MRSRARLAPVILIIGLGLWVALRKSESALARVAGVAAMVGGLLLASAGEISLRHTRSLKAGSQAGHPDRR